MDTELSDAQSELIHVEQTVCAGGMKGDANSASLNQFKSLKKGHLHLVTRLGANVFQLSHTG